MADVPARGVCDMRFFKKPPVGTIRKRFVWWPRRRTEFFIKVFELGQPAVPYVPGILGGNGLMPPGSGQSTGRRKAGAPTGGGMVTPSYRNQDVRSYWVWLEWVLEELTHTQVYGQAAVFRWAPHTSQPQSCIWDEYE